MLCSRMWPPVLWYCWYLSSNMYCMVPHASRLCDFNINSMHNLWPVHTYVVSVLWMVLWTLTIVVVSPHKQVLFPSFVGNLIPLKPFLTEWVSDLGSRVHFSVSSTSLCSWDSDLLRYDALLYVSSTQCFKRLHSLPEDEGIFMVPGAWDHLSSDMSSCHRH